MVEIQLDTYTADSISAHRKIRQVGFFSSDSCFNFVTLVICSTLLSERHHSAISWATLSLSSVCHINVFGILFLICHSLIQAFRHILNELLSG